MDNLQEDLFLQEGHQPHPKVRDATRQVETPRIPSSKLRASTAPKRAQDATETKKEIHTPTTPVQKMYVFPNAIIKTKQKTLLILNPLLNTCPPRRQGHKTPNSGIHRRCPFQNAMLAVLKKKNEKRHYIIHDSHSTSSMSIAVRTTSSSPL